MHFVLQCIEKEIVDRITVAKSRRRTAKVHYLDLI